MTLTTSSKKPALAELNIIMQPHNEPKSNREERNRFCIEYPFEYTNGDYLLGEFLGLYSQAVLPNAGNRYLADGKYKDEMNTRSYA